MEKLDTIIKEGKSFYVIQNLQIVSLVIGRRFSYLVHKHGYQPDPLLEVPPADRIRDGYLADVFPQFANYIESEKEKKKKMDTRLASKGLDKKIPKNKK